MSKAIEYLESKSQLVDELYMVTLEHAKIACEIDRKEEEILSLKSLNPCQTGYINNVESEIERLMKL